MKLVVLVVICWFVTLQSMLLQASNQSKLVNYVNIVMYFEYFIGHRETSHMKVDKHYSLRHRRHGLSRGL